MSGKLSFNIRQLRFEDPPAAEKRLLQVQPVHSEHRLDARVFEPATYRLLDEQSFGDGEPTRTSGGENVGRA